MECSTFDMDAVVVGRTGANFSIFLSEIICLIKINTSKYDAAQTQTELTRLITRLTYTQLTHSFMDCGLYSELLGSSDYVIKAIRRYLFIHL